MITISSVEPLRTGAHGQGPGQHRGPQVEPGGLWNSFRSSFRRASGIPRLPLPGTASKEYECQPFLTQRVMERGPPNRRRERGGESLGERAEGGGRETETDRFHSELREKLQGKLTSLL